MRAMRQKALGTDQAAIGRESLAGRTLMCSQARHLVDAIKVGIVKRSFVMNVLVEKLSDLPAGMEDLLAAFEGPLRDDIECTLSARAPSAASPKKAGRRGVKGQAEPEAVPNAGRGEKSKPAADDASCVRRMREHVLRGRLPADVVKDLDEVFKLYGLSELALPLHGSSGSSGSTSATAGWVRGLHVEEQDAKEESSLREDSVNTAAPSDSGVVQLEPRTSADDLVVVEVDDCGNEIPGSPQNGEKAFAPEKRKKSKTKVVGPKQDKKSAKGTKKVAQITPDSAA